MGFAGYQLLAATGELHRRLEAAAATLESCELCPRRCHVDRLRGQTGQCRTGRRAIVASFGPHFGEEALLVGSGGSGTIFFAHCNLRCVFCQNHSISHQGEGQEVGSRDLAAMMLSLQERGCHNINLVTPTHVVPQILEALELAAAGGLDIPLVYNCGGYESQETLRLLDGIVDIYMPDMKYADSAVGREYSNVEDYAEVNRAAVLEMHRQVGDLCIDRRGLATRGLLVRHLVLPHGLAGTDRTMAFLARQVSPETYLNVMDQYRPCYRASEFAPLSRAVAREEYLEAVALALGHGLRRLDRIEYPQAARMGT